MKKALLVVSFGTSHKETREKNIEAIEKHIAAEYPDRELRRAFTSGMIMRILKKRDDIHIDNVAEAMERLVDEGYRDVLLQPTHIIKGEEYEKLLTQLEPYRKQLESIVVGDALLTVSDDYEDLCHGIFEEAKAYGAKDEDTALVLMGHGTGHFSDSAYAALDYRFKALGYENVFVGTVEGYPDVDTVIEQVNAYMPKKVVLMPLMVVAGDHAVNDMASDEDDSWKTLFKEAGYEVECVLKGLGEMEAIRDMYLEHLKRAEHPVEE